MAIDDLWGELPDVEKIKTPFVILKEQAELLTEKTGGLLVGEVSQNRSIGRDGFCHTLYIVTPSLNNYRYELLTINYEIELYPLRLKKADKESVSCADEDEFKKELEKIFKSQETQNVISKLLVHVNGSVNIF